MNQLLRRNHDELSGFVIGHLMNCVLFSRSPIYVQAPLLCSMLDRLKEFVWLAGTYDVTGQDRQSDKLSVDSSLSEHRVGAECSPSTYLRTRNSSWSDDARSEVSQTRSTPEEEGVSTQLLKHLSLFLGYGAGAIRYLVTNGENSGSG